MDRTAPPPIPQFSSRPPAAVPVDNATMALPSSSPLPSMSLSLTSPRHTDSGSRPVSGPGPARHTDPSSTRNLAEEPSNPPTTPRRWHHRLAPRVERHSPTNALPWPFGGWVHPTHVEFRLPGPGGVHLGRGLVHRRSWRSRQHRKGRYIGTSPKGRARRVEAMVKRKGGIRGKWRRLILKIGRMRMVEYWNISWWVAVVFTLGSTIWVLNGFVVFLPLLLPSRFAEGPSFGSWTAWAGATVFEIGAALAMWEAWNRADTADFGWNVRELWEKGLDAAEEHPPSRAHADKGDRTGLPAPLPLPPPPSSRNEEEGLRWSSTSTASREKNEPGFDGVDRDRLCGEKQKWVWFSTDTKYWHELGFLAAFSQFCGATIFWISGFTGLQEIQQKIEGRTSVLNGIYWLPQVVGGTGFIVSSALIMLETQKKWYIPRPLDLGWHIGFWNFVGAMGFTLCGAFGFAEHDSGAAYQSVLSTYWGSWAFLIGSVAQWYESVNPVR